MRYLLFVALAFVLWFVMFVIKPLNFWIMMAFSTSILYAISIIYYRDQLNREYFKINEILIGISSAFVLYFIFWLGKFILDKYGIIPNHNRNISSVYANKEVFPGWLVALLLFFPIGFGEEMFWRGYLQRLLSEKYNKWIALLITVFFYTAVHIPTMNPILLLASFIVGIYWGLIFLWRGNIIAVVISHMLWDPFIFVIFPIT
ncbi:MAG: type II CAAX endopeptidase family protein [Ignavibacteriae bacterium]|nr:type II CAAX endopeptidase family protein [Ignavibacteriota bacterium]